MEKAKKITVKANELKGKIKPMHAVNNGPVYKFGEDQLVTNIDAYREAGIPYARNHDASFYSTYGGNHTVDVNFIFTDFDKDPYDEESYDFAVTDQYIKVTEEANTRTFYRLGSRIEHEIKKYNTLPPKDFHKWAVICEHIIKHYTEGWANGFHYDMEYWEIWNEPDLDPDDSGNKRTWGGTRAQFFDLFEIAAKHLKKCFPNLKIGGPALAGWEEWAADFLTEMKKRSIPMDFFSWHIYACDTQAIIDKVRRMRKLMDESGYGEAESILNEWNYIKGWTGDDFVYSIKSIKGLKGSAFTASVMCGCQYEPLDMLMYYDARPSGFNGLFNTDIVSECLKGYYPFRMFNELYKLKNCVEVKSDSKDIKACAAVSDDKNELCVMASYYNDDDSSSDEKIELCFDGFSKNASVEAYILDETHDMELVKETTLTDGKLSLNIPLFGTYLLKLKK